jgi:SAM-dependent methyltransferase
VSSWPAWHCTQCGDVLAENAETVLCPREGTVFARQGGVRLLLTEERRASLFARVASYRARRQSEGWRAEPGLPEVPRDHPHHAIWRRRALHLSRAEALLAGRLPNRPWDVLDVGAGSGWLSARLAGQGHRVAAVDLNLDLEDGLLAADRLLTAGTTLARAEAEMERLPLGEASVDCAIAAASLHHASDPLRALREMRRVVREGGLVVVLDTPVYRAARDGTAMRGERGEHVIAGSPGFFTLDGLLDAMTGAGLAAEVHGWPGRMREAMRDVVERAKWHRRTARFPIFLGTVRG